MEIEMKDPCITFAKNLKERRLSLNMTQRELAEMLGYSEKTVSKWESGKVVAPSVILPMLARHLKTDINNLMSDEDTPCYYLGVDGGGTKTELALADEDEKILRRIILPGCNPIDIGIKACLDILSKGIDEICADFPTSKISAFVGIAGGVTGENKARIHEFLDKLGFAGFDNGSDAENAIAQALGNSNGSIVIMGTGTVAFSQIDGILYRRGGFGYLFEEGGSGYSIGRDAIMHALRCEELGEPNDALTTNVRQIIGYGSVRDGLSELYSGGKRKIASFAPAVFLAQDEGDESATQILDRNMSQIARLIESTPTTAPRGERQRVVIVGGLVSREDILLPLIIKHLKDSSEYEITASRTPPIMGALMLAKRIKGGSPC